MLLVTVIPDFAMRAPWAYIPAFPRHSAFFIFNAAVPAGRAGSVLAVYISIWS